MADPPAASSDQAPAPPPDGPELTLPAGAVAGGLGLVIGLLEPLLACARFVLPASRVFVNAMTLGSFTVSPSGGSFVTSLRGLVPRVVHADRGAVAAVPAAAPAAQAPFRPPLRSAATSPGGGSSGTERALMVVTSVLGAASVVAATLQLLERHGGPLNRGGRR
jgi:hypothetical protein